MRPRKSKDLNEKKEVRRIKMKKYIENMNRCIIVKINNGSYDRKEFIVTFD
jgi:hypothetical protein